VTTKIQ